MGIYENWVLPRLLDLAMRNQVLDSYRRGPIKSAHGLVLEIGVGSGLNFSIWPRGDQGTQAIINEAFMSRSGGF